MESISPACLLQGRLRLCGGIFSPSSVVVCSSAIVTKTSFSEDQLDQVMSFFELMIGDCLFWIERHNTYRLKSCWIVLDFVCRALYPRSIKRRPEFPFCDT
jgi:hypothetical protein